MVLVKIDTWKSQCRQHTFQNDILYGCLRAMDCLHTHLDLLADGVDWVGCRLSNFHACATFGLRTVAGIKFNPLRSWHSTIIVTPADCLCPRWLNIS